MEKELFAFLFKQNTILIFITVQYNNKNDTPYRVPGMDVLHT